MQERSSRNTQDPSKSILYVQQPLILYGHPYRQVPREPSGGASDQVSYRLFEVRGHLRIWLRRGCALLRPLRWVHLVQGYFQQSITAYPSPSTTTSP